jgi:L-gulonate 3-dehydrogenase
MGAAGGGRQIVAKIACIGAGTVGRAWAVVFARGGYDVWLYDALQGEVASRAIPLARETLELLATGSLLEEPVETVFRRIHPAATIAEAVTDAVLVQESVKEDVTIKRQVFAEIDAFAPNDCFLCSSTSAIPGSDFLGAVSNPQRALVAHPVNPPSLIPLVELCATRWSSSETLSQVRDIMTAAGMKPVTVLKEIDGFLLNRLQFTLVAEALHLVGEGYCTAEDIDTVMTQGLALRWASIGPFETMHLNAATGFQGFAANLGAMMRHLGANARTDYDWSPDLIASIHAELAAKTSIDKIPERQAWRNGRIMATRKLI